ncbi:ABC transporter substrate-binding protein [Desulfopila inferna]|uniref:ABC transporter substrate-binding protein n=1 Tax=Desulfopila inferna TaxID=468528 RepID=UPI001F05D04C|nr:ABC transporter substrate-binding protein [Desulfopila inferna]
MITRRSISVPVVSLIVAFSIVFTVPAMSDEPLLAVKHQPIVLGQSCALSGPAQNLGLELRAGLLAAFSKKNDEGGIRGRDILLISRDDGYEPDRAIRNIRSFIEKHNVFMIIGEVGTPTSKAVIPLIEQHEVPFFGPFTGAEFLREPFRKNIINVRGSYYQEMEKLASYLIDEKKISRIACFYQNDSYGLDGLQGIRQALKRRGMKLVSEGTYERNTVAVMGGLRDVHKGNPEAIVLVGAYSACAEFIKLSKVKEEGERIYCSISFVGTESLQKALGRYAENVIVSQVVPNPRDSSLPLIKEYLEAMSKYQHDVPISFTSLEGYIAGKLFSEIATHVQGELTRKNFVDTMESIGRFDLGGLVLSFGEKDHQGLDEIYLTRIMPTIQVIETAVQ